MRIRLRLYARDLDLIALKHNPNFDFKNTLKTALQQYVTTGYCCKVTVPPPDNNYSNIVLQSEICDITINENVYSEVVEWINNLRTGMRGVAIKAVLRAAIENPDLQLFMENSNLIVPQKEDNNKFKKETKQKNKIDEIKTPPKDDINKPVEVEINIDDDWFENY